ncbi:formyl transferase [Echinicola marina]|uniref:formyl transferase n=1 Tax=Echinicola marina TaxID=2859768 RepID=UPI001CF7167F|nr:formyl transferase [Echinicola marina]UCS94727.1 formyl transferase [Echinicola marina]
MKIVVVSECKAREMVAVKRIIQFFPNAIIVKPIYPKGKKNIKSLPKRLFQKGQYSMLKRMVLENNPEAHHISHIPIDAVKINDAEGIHFFKELAPDILITCRAPILSPEIIQIAKTATVNLHYGIAPKYRGNDSLFWALFHNDYENLGGCIHHIDQGVDTGNILAEVYPPLNSTDNELSIGIKTSHLLGIAIVNFIKAQEKSLSPILGKPQKDKGKNYHYSERTLLKSIRLLLRFQRNLTQIPESPQKIITYFKKEAVNIFA